MLFTYSLVVVCVWKDHQIVIMATTFNAVEGTTFLQWSKEKIAKISIAQLQMYANCNKGVGGVDLLDQMVSVYRSNEAT